MRLVLLLYFFFLTFVTCLNGQKTVYNFDLPEQGDILYYKLDNLPDNLNLEFHGSRKAWNLSMLNAPTAHKFSFQNATRSIFASYFKGAHLVSYDLWQNEMFYKKLGNGLFLIGEVIKSNREKSNPLLKRYTDPKPVYSMKYELNKELSYQSKWEMIFNGEELDLTGQDESRLYKLEVVEDNEERIEGTGLLFLPRQRYEDVIKLVRSVYSTYSLYKSMGNDEWQEVKMDDF